MANLTKSAGAAADTSGNRRKGMDYHMAMFEKDINESETGAPTIVPYEGMLWTCKGSLYAKQTPIDTTTFDVIVANDHCGHLRTDYAAPNGLLPQIPIELKLDGNGVIELDLKARYMDTTVVVAGASHLRNKLYDAGVNQRGAASADRMFNAVADGVQAVERDNQFARRCTATPS